VESISNGSVHSSDFKIAISQIEQILQRSKNATDNGVFCAIKNSEDCVKLIRLACERIEKSIGKLISKDVPFEDLHLELSNNCEVLAFLLKFDDDRFLSLKKNYTYFASDHYKSLIKDNLLQMKKIKVAPPTGIVGKSRSDLLAKINSIFSKNNESIDFVTAVEDLLLTLAGYIKKELKLSESVQITDSSDTFKVLGEKISKVTTVNIKNNYNLMELID
jgi:hypothetical protein